MKCRHALAAAFLFALSLPAAAKDLDISGLAQTDFRLLSEDLGAALSYKPLTPAEPLGLFGFDIGIAATGTKLENSAAFQKAGVDNVSTAVVPSVRLNLGLPFRFDIGAMAGGVPGTNVRLWGTELRFAILGGGVAVPAIGIRGSYTKLTGVDQLDFDTKGLDISISKGFAFFTPYAGVGRVWVTSAPKDLPTAIPTTESFSLNKLFVGANLNFAIVNFAFEGDRTGDATSYGLKIGFRF
jgi:hypothetical protein